MKIINFIPCLLIFPVLWPTAARAKSIEIALRNHPVITIDVATHSHSESLGQVTVEAFKSNNIPFEGSDVGITSIQGQGSDLEIISDRMMKAWGWCYSIDGEVIDRMPDQVTINKSARVIKWFYAYALYDSGTWTGYCINE